MKRLLAIIVFASLACPSSGLAQQQPAPAPPVDGSKLGVSLDRIRRELAEPQATDSEGNPVRLEIRVEVFGRAPRYDLLDHETLTSKAVPYGSPTHREMLDVVTPQLFRQPVMPISSMVFWAAKELWNLSKKSRCEQEIAAYRELVMQGVSVAAPRCTQ